MVINCTTNIISIPQNETEYATSITHIFESKLTHFRSGYIEYRIYINKNCMADCAVNNLNKPIKWLV